MASTPKRAAVIGAGVSGIVAAAHLKKEGIDVTVFERSSAAGGVWYGRPIRNVSKLKLNKSQAVRRTLTSRTNIPFESRL
jgi:cation diffusion facilitator CzcD-associated flavoprotein CzcO